MVWPAESVSYVAHVEAKEIEEVKPEWTFNTLTKYLAKKYGQDEALARRIIQCESQTNQSKKNDNYTKSGVYWSSDHGYWQINDYWHERTAARRGFNIYLWDENLEYGFILLKEQGTEPWTASRHCWYNQ